MDRGGNHGSNLLSKFSITRMGVTEVNTWEMGNYDSSYTPQASHSRSSQDYGYREQYIHPPPPTLLVPSKGIFRKICQLESETWLVEVLSMATSLLAAVLIILFLRHYDGNPYPDLPKSITLNALLSVGITIMLTAVGIPISSGLGQLNWIRARKAPVSLSKMDTMDKGSRGAWGSMLVIFGWAGGPTGALGAFAVILALAAAPLAQQAILIEANQTLSTLEQPLIVRCDNSTGFFTGDTKSVDGKGGELSTRKSIGNQLPYVMVGEYYNSIYNNFDNSTFSDDFATCASGNCTWPLFATLSICSQCVNITKSLVSSKFEYPGADLKEWSVPGQGDAFVSPVVTWNLSNTERSNRVHSSYATATRFAVVQLEKGGGATALECTLSFCVQVINATVVNGRLNETILNTYDFDDSTIKTMTRNMTVQPPVPAPQGSPFTTPILLDLKDPEWINQTLNLQGSYGPSGDEGLVTFMLQQRRLGNITATINDVAMSMGRSLRTICSGSVKVAGSALTPVALVRIRWYWLIVPFLVEALGLIFFLIVVVLNLGSGARLWKTSFLAPCFHGLKLESSSQPLSFERIHEMDAVASVKVRLVDDLSGDGRSRLRY